MNLYDTLPRTAVEPVPYGTAAERRRFDQERRDADLDRAGSPRAVLNVILTYCERRLAAWRAR